jgi:hypothetical protein
MPKPSQAQVLRELLNYNYGCGCRMKKCELCNQSSRSNRILAKLKEILDTPK